MKLAESYLKMHGETERQTELYRKASQGGVFVVQLVDGWPIIYANDIYYKIIDYQRDSLDKSNFKLENIIYAEDTNIFNEKLIYAIDKDVDLVDIELRIVTHSGQLRWVSICGSFELHQGIRYLNGFMTDVTEKHMLMDKVSRLKEMFIVALKNLDMSVWEYDVDRKELLRLHNTKCFEFLPDTINSIPESVIKMNFINANSCGDFSNLFERFGRGETDSVYTDIKMRIPGAKAESWERITITTIQKQDGRVKKGLFISENITAQKQAEINYQSELALKDTFSAGFIVGSRSNLSKNVVEFVQAADKYFDGPKSGASYDDMFNFKKGFVSNDEDRERYLSLFSRAALLKAFGKNQTSISLDHRYNGKDGKICWANITARLLKEAAGDDVYIYENIRDISGQKAIELSMAQRAERDSLTSAYERDTALKMIEDAMLTTSKHNSNCVLLLFNIDNFIKIVHRSGYKTADDLVKKLYEIINNELSEPKIIGRLASDELVVWGCVGHDINQIYKQAEHIRYLVNKAAVVPNELQSSISVGIAFSEESRYNCAQMLDKAQDALTICWEMGGNCCNIFEEKEHTETYGNSKNSSGAGNLLANSVLVLERGEPFNKSARNILCNVAGYYGAECACLIEMDVHSGELREVYNCSDDMKCSKLSKQEILQKILRILNDNRSVFAEGENNSENNSQDLFDRLNYDGLYGVYTLVLEQEGKIIGYLSIANPSKNRQDMAFFESIACVFTNNIVKRQNKDYLEYIKYHDEATGLLNRNSYVRFVAEFSSDAASSMGILVADINGLRQINLLYGRERGDSLLTFVGKVLGNIPDTKAFRLSGDEFVLVGENLTLEAFQERVQIVKDMIDEHHPDSISIAYVWDNNDINPDQLVLQADEKLSITKRMLYKDGQKITKYSDPKDEQVLLEEISQGRYEMYLQPKALVKTGAVSGAEALIRYHNKNGELVPPVRFIPQLEQTGNVFYIDLFIFEEVCKTIRRWQKENKKLIPISLNFSRVTLLQEDLLNTIEGIYARYQIPKHLIEIEVAESMGSVERQSLVNISADIVKNGYRLSLDDFGSKYSNMSILSVLDLHVLKLDKSLVNDLLSNNNTKTVLKNFMITCRDLGIVSVAEGVETKEQLDILRDLDCDYAQGYYFNKPIPCAEFERLYLK